MENHFDISDNIEIREVDIAAVACSSPVVYDNRWIALKTCGIIFVFKTQGLKVFGTSIYTIKKNKTYRKSP